MKQQITIEIPMGIPRALTPNRSRAIHWGTITKLKNHLQGTVLVCAIDAKNRWLKENPKAKLPFQKGTIWYELVVKDRRSIMDDDNAVAGLKCVRDMLQVETETQNRAGIIGNDRDFLTAQIMWTISKERAPKTIVTVRSS